MFAKRLFIKFFFDIKNICIPFCDIYAIINQLFPMKMNILLYSEKDSCFIEACSTPD